jgi:hypothetical protein
MNASGDTSCWYVAVSMHHPLSLLTLAGQIVNHLIHRLDAVARVEGYNTCVQPGTYIARPYKVCFVLSLYRGAELSQFTADQSNSYDCGVWVLAMVATVLFGCSYNTVTEASSPDNGAYRIRDMHRLFLQFCLEVPPVHV